jgi:hypothetical protein
VIESSHWPLPQSHKTLGHRGTKLTKTESVELMAR